MLKPKADSNEKVVDKILREIVSSGSNKNCFECHNKGVTYVDITIGIFVCTSCSGILRGLTPPHRVKSISMAKFTNEELEFLRTHGNEECAKTWLGLWDAKRTIKQDLRDFMIDKYERKRYYLEPASPLKSINTPSQQQPLQINGLTAKTCLQQADNSLVVLKSIHLTPPTAANRHHHNRNHQQNGFGADNNNNLFNQQTNGSSPQNGSIKSDNSSDFVADFTKASIYNSNNSLSSAGSDMNANFADFDNNKIYNAGLPMTTKNTLSNSLNSSGGTFNSNSSLNSAPSADRYAALKDLDEQLRDTKTVDVVAATTEPAAIPMNPFKNPFQSTQQQQSYQNWTIPESHSPFTGLGSTVNNTGFYYNQNMTNGIIAQPFVGGKGEYGNPFMAAGPASANNPFL